MSGKRQLFLLIFLMAAAFGGSVQTAGAQFAQPSEPPPSDCLPTDPDTDPRICVPLDGGLAFLLAAGVGYGFFKKRPVQGERQPIVSSGSSDK